MQLRKILMILILILCTSCKTKNKEVVCRYVDMEDMRKAYLNITLTYDNNKLKEKLHAKYKYESISKANENYPEVEKILGEEETIKVHQEDDAIIADGERLDDVSKDEYASKIAYYEELGYTCK